MADRRRLTATPQMVPKLAPVRANRTYHACDNTEMRRRITERELRNDIGRIMRALIKGRAFVVTSNGVPVGDLVPLRKRAFVPIEIVMAVFAAAPRIEGARFRKNVVA